MNKTKLLLALLILSAEVLADGWPSPPPPVVCYPGGLGTIICR